MASWRAILRHLDLQNDSLKAISLFKSMQKARRNDPVSDPYVYASLIKECNKLLLVKEGKSIHGRVIRLGLDNNTNVLNSLIHFYMRSNELVSYACLLFDRMPERSVVTVNSMVSGFLKNKQFDVGLGLFNEALCGAFGPGLNPNYVTLMILISGCVEIGGYKSGILLHSYCCKTGLVLIIEVCNTLIDFYAKFGYMADAVSLFNAMVERDLVSWNTMIAGYARSNNCNKAVSLFRKMRYGNIGYDRVSLINLLLACANCGDLDAGKVIHGYIIASGEEITVSLGTVLINMYSKCGLIEFARKVFDERPDKTIASWNSMIHGYVESRHDGEALELFNLMKSRMLQPDEVTMLGLILACRNSGKLSHGIAIHSYIKSSDHLKGRIVLQNALVDMYAKCGNMARAKAVFDKIPQKDVVSWTSIIVGHAINGEGEEALLGFRQMCAEKVEPNSVTFIGVLSACNHSGLVDVGQNLYDIMTKVYNIEPKIEHCGCVVDMLARAGMLDEANEFVKKMPVEPNTVIWRMLINACRVHGDIDLGLSLVSGLVEAKTSHSAENHVISSNIFAEAGRWGDVLHARSLTGAWKAPKMAGRSSILDLID